MKQMRKW